MRTLLLAMCVFYASSAVDAQTRYKIEVVADAERDGLANLSTQSRPAVGDDGAVYFTADVTGDIQGIRLFRYRDGSFGQISSPGATVIRSVQPSPSGRVVAWLEQSNVTGETVIQREVDGSLVTVPVTGDAIPGSFSSLAVTETGIVAYASGSEIFVVGPIVGPAIVFGAGDIGNPESIIAIDGQGVPVYTASLNATPPIGGVVFRGDAAEVLPSASLQPMRPNVDVSAAGSLYFTGVGGIESSWGIYRSDFGAVTKFADLESAPTVESGLAVNDVGDVVAVVNPAGAAPFGINRYRSDGSVTTVLQNGGTLQSGQLGVTLGSRSLGPGGLNNRGQIAARVLVQSNSVVILATPTNECTPDLAAPAGVLDQHDVSAFLTAIDPGLAFPVAAADFSDVIAWLRVFDLGCDG